jgi:hypothetical protein
MLDAREIHKALMNVLGERHRSHGPERHPRMTTHTNPTAASASASRRRLRHGAHDAHARLRPLLHPPSKAAPA